VLKITFSEVKMLIAGFDIGGTKSAALAAEVSEEGVEFLFRRQVLDELLDSIIYDSGINPSDIAKAGISCGGPLDGKKGMLLAPPNLTGWAYAPLCRYISKRLNVKTYLMNDADACAVAEWKYGAGKGFDNVIFLTFGTGMGAGLILNGKLYTGAKNMAGEIGRIRLTEEGPVGYGKRGSFEGYCSGGGIAQQIKTYFIEKLQMGIKSPLCPDFEMLDALSAKDIVLAADSGDIDAINILNQVGAHLGRGLAVLIDILNPELIIIGGVFMRGHRHLTNAMYQVLKAEAHELSLSACKIVPSMLGEKIGDYGAIMAAMR
jgi:glucokinase